MVLQQIFSSFDLFDTKSFFKFSKITHQKFGKIFMIVYKASQYRKYKIAQKYSSTHKDEITLVLCNKLTVFECR